MKRRTYDLEQHVRTVSDVPGALGKKKNSSSALAVHGLTFLARISLSAKLKPISRYRR
jgi:hypothetical protein